MEKLNKVTIWDAVKPEIKFIAADMNGDIYGYDFRPTALEIDDDWHGINCMYGLDGLNIDPWWTDWRKSLISRHVDESQWIGKWCFVWDDAICQTLLRVLGGIVVNHPQGYRYSDSIGILWRNARPATKEELFSRCFDPSE